MVAHSINEFPPKYSPFIRLSFHPSLPASLSIPHCPAYCLPISCASAFPALHRRPSYRHVLITNANDETIRIQNMRLGTHSGVCLSRVLKGHPLVTLDLFGNVIRDVGASKTCCCCCC